MTGMPSPPASDVLGDFEARGLVHDSTDRRELARRLAEGAISVYCGFDPTADSLHVGHLLGILALRRFQLAGHRPIALAGGATGMIGDPSGRSEERNLLDAETLATNLVAIEGQLRRLLAGDGSGPEVAFVDNASWTGGLGLVEFLRDVGKHVSVNQMLGREAVRARLAGTEGLSFTEFSYVLLQAHDYVWLHQHEGCDLQVGGSDQWGNIAAGVDLVRRRTGHQVHGLTWPLLTRADGTKFGKSAGTNVWLDPRRTSPYAFYQHWMQVDDVDVARFLLQLTLLGTDEVDAVVAEHRQAPARRAGQRRLAWETTALVHGAEAAVAAQAASEVLFGARSDDVPTAAYRMLEGELGSLSLERSRLRPGAELDRLLVETGLTVSLGDARRQLAQGAVYVNGRRVQGEGATLSGDDLRQGGWILLRRGKREHRLVRAVGD
jgi:tyrosyl-tRNA synthetase